jgi:hypothetical protein
MHSNPKQSHYWGGVDFTGYFYRNDLLIDTFVADPDAQRIAFTDYFERLDSNYEMYPDFGELWSNNFTPEALNEEWD